MKHIYRIMSRPPNGDREWRVSAGGRVYRTIGTARGIKTQMENRQKRYSYNVGWEFKVQRAPVETSWQDVAPDAKE